MHELNELLQWCISNKAWLTVNYSPFSDGYKVFVNPGRTMTSAKWFKTMDEAVKACWVAIGGKPKDEAICAGDFVEEVGPGYYKKTNDPENIYGVALSNKEIAAGLVNIPVIKRRGRPKGSKNKPKVVANE